MRSVFGRPHDASQQNKELEVVGTVSTSTKTGVDSGIVLVNILVAWFEVYRVGVVIIIYEQDKGISDPDETFNCLGTISDGFPLWGSASSSCPNSTPFSHRFLD